MAWSKSTRGDGNSLLLVVGRVAGATDLAWGSAGRLVHAGRDLGRPMDVNCWSCEVAHAWAVDQTVGGFIGWLCSLEGDRL